MTRLPFLVRAYGATIAAFNDVRDAEAYAQATSSEPGNTKWFEVRDAESDIMIVAYASGNEVYGL